MDARVTSAFTRVFDTLLPAHDSTKRQEPRNRHIKEPVMLIIPTGSFAAIDAARDFTFAQLDIIAAASGGAMHAVTNGAVDPFVFRFSIFVLAIFVGYYVVWSVTPALHTPLMSVTNAISSVIVVGALLAVGVALVAGDKGPIWARVLGFIALIFASINIFGGFLVTQRMLGMYQKKK
jgi:NAD(P) transhydrogenase subunit alpha